MRVSHKQFEKMVNLAVDNLPAQYKDRLGSLVFVTEDEVSAEQAKQMGLGPGALLFGVYEGAPLPMRNGGDKLLPDRITLYKNPHEQVSASLEQMQERVNHTVWHEVAHYFGLDHDRIHELDGSAP